MNNYAERNNGPISEEPVIDDIDDDDSQIQKDAKLVQKSRMMKGVLSMIPEDQNDKINSMSEILNSFPANTEQQRKDSSNPNSISDFNQGDLSSAQQKTQRSTFKFDQMNTKDNLQVVEEKIIFENVDTETVQEQ